MTAFPFRMGAGFPGDVNRSHPVSIEPALIDASAPPLAYGLAVVVDPTTQGVRQMAPGDSALTAVYGVTVRPYPFQQSSAVNNGAIGYGAGAPPTSGPIDVLRSGYIMAPVVGTPVKGATVYVWIAASTGAHVQGGFEASASGSNTIPLTGAGSLATFNGGADASGIAEIEFNV